MSSSLDTPASKRQRTDSGPSPSSLEDQTSPSANRGLAECQEMDAALALVASADVHDVNPYLLDCILLNIEFCNLLDIRRVCKEWHAALCRESAPFLQDVVIDLASLYLKRLDVAKSGTNLWLLAPKARTVFMFGGTFGETEIEKLLRPYTNHVVTHRMFLPIRRVTFARTVVLSTAFRCLMFQRASVQIVVYKSTVNFAVADVFRYRTAQADSYAAEFNQSLIPVVFNKSTFVMTQNLIPAMDMTKKQQRHHSVAAIHFAMKAFPFSQSRLSTLYNNIRRFPATKLEDLVRGLLRRFGPAEVDIAVVHFLLHHDRRGFVATVHPMVTLLLNHYLKLIGELRPAVVVAPALQPQPPVPPPE